MSDHLYNGEYPVAELYQAVELVSEFVAERSSAKGFLEQFNQGYVANALDGHESEGGVPEAHRLAYELVEAVMGGAVGIIIPENEANVEMYLSSGRIQISDLLSRVRQIVCQCAFEWVADARSRSPSR